MGTGPRAGHEGDALRRGLTYTEVGASLAETMPAGYHHTRERLRLGTGRELFERHAEAVLTFEMHRRAGLVVTTDAPRAAPGVDVEVALPIGPLLVRAPDRVVAVVDEPDRRGFAYGTRAGHPERGEESFVVSIEPDGGVWFEVRAFWRSVRWYSVLGGPVTVAVQRAITRRYLAVRVP
ncbi:DUF1990 domain-containing protein [Actinotalea ferrariae]|uniref:DUF1990 family protein n=1 Tax=Actinotalea ferrariae TaxID=1386098 RepID=UPI001C8B2B7F|nr:DUF1990 domain-containing protein [Actinotalea ferrariae]MBX9243982.1 DUF1990 domain-containing protein [Actinotalea ferrariae]